MRSHAVLEDGGRVRLSDLERRVPRSSLRSALHLDVCERWSDAAPLEPEVRATYLNLLFVRSRRARQITALVVLMRTGALRVRRVVSDFVGPEHGELIGVPIESTARRRRAHNHIDAIHVLRFAAKTVAHRLYRLLSARRPLPATVVRGWMEATDAAFPDRVRHDGLLIYPFSVRWSRQLRYVARGLREGRPLRLYGVPYRLRGLLALLAGLRRRDVVLARLETAAFRAHARELLDAGIERLYTTDEFEVAAHAFHAALERGGVHTHNASHGVGIYGPVVHYGHFRFYNRRQARFYAARGRLQSASVRGHLPADFEPAPPGPGFAPVVVYVLGNWQQVGPAYERDLERRILEAARDVAAALDLPFVIKSHPNLKWWRARRLRRRLRVRMIRHLEPLEGHPIFVNMLSTAFYDFARLGPTLFVGDALLRPADVFGEGVHAVRLEALAAELERFGDPQYWEQRHRADLRLLREEAR